MPPLTRPLQILIVEDEPIIAFDLHDMLDHAGHDVIGCAATVAEALGVLSARHPDIILTDLNLGAGGSGADVVRNAMRRNIPCVVVSGNYAAKAGGCPEEIEGLPIAAMVAKPFTPDQIANALTTATAA